MKVEPAAGVGLLAFLSGWVAMFGSTCRAGVSTVVPVKSERVKCSRHVKVEHGLGAVLQTPRRRRLGSAKSAVPTPTPISKQRSAVSNLEPDATVATAQRPGMKAVLPLLTAAKAHARARGTRCTLEAEAQSAVAVSYGSQGAWKLEEFSSKPASPRSLVSERQDQSRETNEDTRNTCGWHKLNRTSPSLVPLASCLQDQTDLHWSSMNGDSRIGCKRQKLSSISSSSVLPNRHYSIGDRNQQDIRNGCKQQDPCFVAQSPALSPTALDGRTNSTGVDIKENIRGNFEEDVFCAMVPPPTSSQIGCHNSARLSGMWTTSSEYSSVSRKGEAHDCEPRQASAVPKRGRPSDPLPPRSLLLASSGSNAGATSSSPTPVRRPLEGAGPRTAGPAPGRSALPQAMDSLLLASGATCLLKRRRHGVAKGTPPGGGAEAVAGWPRGGTDDCQYHLPRRPSHLRGLPRLELLQLASKLERQHLVRP